ncbi:MAG: hypothetical protein AAGF12_04070 [Myxococcota bacterium]
MIRPEWWVLAAVACGGCGAALPNTTPTDEASVSRDVRDRADRIELYMDSPPPRSHERIEAIVGVSCTAEHTETSQDDAMRDLKLRTALAEGVGAVDVACVDLGPTPQCGSEVRCSGVAIRWSRSDSI